MNMANADLSFHRVIKASSHRGCDQCSYGLFNFNPARFNSTPHPGVSGISIQPSFGTGSWTNRSPKSGTIVSALGLMIRNSAIGQLVNAYCRWYENTLDPCG